MWGGGSGGGISRHAVTNRQDRRLAQLGLLGGLGTRMCPVNTSLYAPRRRPADEGLKIPPTLPLVLMWYPSWLTVSTGFQNLFNNRAQLRHAVGPVVGLPGRDVVFGFDVTIQIGRAHV